jgi:hypothetical protein
MSLLQGRDLGERARLTGQYFSHDTIVGASGADLSETAALMRKFLSRIGTSIYEQSLWTRPACWHDPSKPGEKTNLCPLERITFRLSSTFRSGGLHLATARCGTGSICIATESNL